MNNHNVCQQAFSLAAQAVDALHVKGAK